MPFEKGQSGNPAGRPRGSRSRATMALQDMLARDAESIARTAINLAKHGNIPALRICMDRLLPPRRKPHLARDGRQVRGYPDGYRIAELGTFEGPEDRGTGGGGCPFGAGAS